MRNLIQLLSLALAAGAVLIAERSSKRADDAAAALVRKEREFTRLQRDYRDLIERRALPPVGSARLK